MRDDKNYPFMSRLSFASLRVQLLLVVLLAVLPVFGFNLYTFREQQQLARADAQEDALRVITNRLPAIRNDIADGAKSKRAVSSRSVREV